MKKKSSVVADYLLCVFGALLVALGVYFFKFPNHFSTGGVSGISVVLSGYFGISSASNVMFIINLLLLLVGFLALGRECGLKTVIGTLTLSGALLLFERVLPLSAPLTDEPLLELIFAVALPAVGSAILFNRNGSTGGTDILAMILRRHTSMDIGTALLLTDLVITLAAFLFGVKTGLYSLFGLIFKALAIDSVIENINICKCFQIITEHPDEISAYISGTLHRSTTIIRATGGYTHGDKYLVITAMRRYQARLLQRFLREKYPDSFMMIQNSSEIIGHGFRGL